MARETAIIIFTIEKRNFSVDLEVPVSITAKELIIALNTAYDLKIDTGDIQHCYLKAEHPIALLRGNRTLEEFGLRNGSIVTYTEEQANGAKVQD